MQVGRLMFIGCVIMLLCIEDDFNSADLWKFSLEFIATFQLKAFCISGACACVCALLYSINPKLKHTTHRLQFIP